MSPEDELYERLKSVAATAPPNTEQEGRGSPDSSVPITVRNLFTHQDVHPIVLDFALIRAFGLEWFGWETATVWAEIQRVFQTNIAELTRAKIQTIKSCHISNLPWEKWQVFEKIVQGLNNNIPHFEIMQAPSLEQLYAAIDILEGLRKVEFSNEVKLYMAAAVLHEDVTFVPPPLDFIQIEVTQPYYECLDCHNEDSALFHDGICDTCSKKYDPANGLGGQPDKEMLEAGRGKNVKLMLYNNPDAVQTLWNLVKDRPTEEAANSLDETAEGTQVAKLLIARDYMNVRRRQMADQLTSLKTWLGTV